MSLLLHSKGKLQRCAYPFLWLLPLWINTSSVYASSLQQIEQYAEDGAHQLALQILVAEQPQWQQSSDDWWRWERVRLTELQLLQRWQTIVTRYNSYTSQQKDQLPAPLLQIHIAALQQLQQYQTTLQLVTTRLWQNYRIEPDYIQQWRKLIVESYLDLNDRQSALAALRRYQLDYSLNGNERLLQAEVLLLNGFAAEAEQILLQQHSKESRWQKLLYIAQILQQKDLQAIDVVAKKQSKRQKSAEMLTNATLLLYLVAAKLQKQEEAIELLEQLLNNSALSAVDRNIANISSTELWRRYLDLAEMVANENKLLIGDDQQWFELAQKLASKQAIHARVLYVYLLVHGSSKKVVEQAVSAYLAQLDRQKLGQRLVDALYADMTPAQPSETMTLRLIDNAIVAKDHQRAAVLIAPLTRPPTGVARFVWDTRRAKIAILAGDFAAARQNMLQALPDLARVTAKYFDRYMQLIFDLQLQQQHELALELLYKIEPHLMDMDQLREHHFWVADSLGAQKKYQQAAMSYFNSANAIAEKKGDPWAQTALYNAAKMLLQAELTQDAKNVLQRLLVKTSDKQRKQMLQQEIDAIAE